MNQFLDNKDGTITDLDNSFMWYKKSIAYVCKQEAMNKCKELEIAGYKDWRLPTVQELKTLIDYQCGNNIDRLNELGFDLTDDCYWTSTNFAVDKSNAWYVYITIGGAGFVNKKDEMCVLAVRNINSKGI